MYMLASKASLFARHQYYDSFALFAANRLYFRLTNPKQFELINGEPRMKKISSILNYANKVLYPIKVDFEQSEYAQTVLSRPEEELEYNYDNVIKSSLEGVYRVEFDMVLHDIGKTCRLFLSTLPYKKNSAEWLNIYVSVMLTLLDSITLKNKNVRRIKHLESTNRLHERHLDSMFGNEKQCEAILFHLPESMRDYITVLTRQLRRIVARDLLESIENYSQLVMGETDGQLEEYYEYQE